MKSTRSFPVERLLPVVMIGLGIAGSAAGDWWNGRHWGGSRGPVRQCSVASLSGDYGYTVTGMLVAGPTPGPFAAVGRLSFDGQGNFQNIRTLNRNGVISPWVAGDGTYTIKEDCTGSFEFTEGGEVTTTTDIVVDDGGKEIRMVTTSPGTVLTVQGRKIFP